MHSINLSFQQPTLPVLVACDAVVIGASFGGVAAALELAHAGYSVTLVEPRTYPGREITATLRPWLKTEDGAPLPKLLTLSLDAAGKRTGQGEFAFNLDALKIHLEDVLIEAGVKLLYASMVVGVQQQNSVLQGVIIGNKSGRQVIACRLLLDTSETALVAHLLGESFQSFPPSAIYQRVLEFDHVGSLNLDAPMTIEGVSVKFHAGFRDKGHVMVECALDLDAAYETAFDLAQREIVARQQTMAVAAALARDLPAFESAYLSGASYELWGLQTARIACELPPQWASQFTDHLKLDQPLPPADFAGDLAGVWLLNAAVPAANVAPERFDDPVFTSAAGAALGGYLAQHWAQVSAPKLSESAAPTPESPVPSTYEVREPFSPQQGRAYLRVTDVSNALPLLRSVDVLVVGGGSSGATAAITAAREGVRTALVEMNPGLGGTGTFGGVHSYWFGHRIGFAENVMQLVDDMHVYLHHPQPKGLIPKWNIEAKSYALLKAAVDAGADILLNAFVIGALVDGDQVGGVVVATRAGIGVIRAKVVIDASGDGDVAAFAGADYIYGNERDHVVMWYALAQFPRPGLTRNHFTSMVDVSNIEDYARAILAGRRRGGTKEEMHDHGIYIAPRESRHIKADIVLTLTDQLRERRWQDVINVPFSNHDVKGHTGSDWLRVGLIPPNLEIEIPYRALLPRGLENILVVGKAFSATHDALPAIRMQADLENLGGAAALAAAQAVRTGESLRTISLTDLQTRLVEANVLPPAVLTRALHTRTYSDAGLRALIDAMPTFPLYDYSDMELTDLYEGAIPLVELCCAGAQVIPLLVEALAKAERKVLLAQALALVSANQGVPVLIEAINVDLQDDTLPPRSAHIRYTQLPPDHGAMPDVVYLLYSLGMVADARAIPVWQRVVDLLATATEEDFYDGMKGVFYYVDAVCFGIERLATPDLIPLLEQMHTYTSLHGKTAYASFQPDFVQERLAYLELVIGRTLARCASVDGYLILVSYLSDNRVLLAEHAQSELVAITGVDHGKDVAAWSRWIELNADDLESVAFHQLTEPMQAWGEVILTDR